MASTPLHSLAKTIRFCAGTMRISIIGLVAVFMIALAASCSSRPDGVLRPGKMEDVLYDYHLARGIALGEGKTDSERDRKYEEAVFAKYGITADEFYASLRYYEAHPKEFSKIYANLDERFSGRSSSLPEQDKNANPQQQGEDIWNGPRFFVLAADGTNHYDFDLMAPRSLQQGDRIEWTFDTQWIYPEGRKHGTALLVFHFDNDSTATFSQPLYGTGRQNVIAPVGTVKPKRITGFIYEETAWGKKVRLLVISNVSMRVVKKSKSEPRFRSMPDSASRRPHPDMRPDSSPEFDSMPVPTPVPDKGQRLTREEGERRILDSVRRHERGKQGMFQ